MSASTRGNELRVQLLSDSCTTGWAHWGHGHLWLTPDSVVRFPRRGLTLAAAGRGAAAGLAAGAFGAMAREMSRAAKVGGEVDVASADWDAYLASCPGRLRVDLADVVSARLWAGLTTSRLALELVEARPVKLLWMRNGFAIPALRAVLGNRLG
jgi:hypothetical protein